MEGYANFIQTNGKVQGLNDEEIKTIMVRAHRILWRFPEEEREKVLMEWINNAVRCKKEQRGESENKDEDRGERE